MKSTGDLYELFILGRLMARPFHGYLLRRLLEFALGPSRQISWGVLYPLIRRLEDTGLIVEQANADATARSQESERQRRAYQITEAGKARFYEMMRETSEHQADYIDWFTIKLSFFAHVERDQQLDILRHYRDDVQFVRQYTLKTRQRVATLPAIHDFERMHYLRMIDHKLHLLDADLVWVEAEIARE